MFHLEFSDLVQSAEYNICICIILLMINLGDSMAAIYPSPRQRKPPREKHWDGLLVLAVLFLEFGDKVSSLIL